ncbi:MBL fold metallo-hydrolase [Microbacterium sp. NPDC055910]|uniref:MBL fold metallo-hydrolase n=1 Tax=Microbacterium sp. NPDC055910 TaxID=3345659 RepID=UPI0035D8317E
MTADALPLVARTSALTTRILAPNAGPMTLDGTNTYVLRAPGSASVVVVDPGPLDDDHLARITAEGTIELILLTHHHIDHVEAAPELARRTGAPVRAWDAALCADAANLQPRERLEAAGTRIDVLHTPGHTADSVCFLLADDATLDGAATASVLTGDTILGRGTTVIAPPDGSLGAYLASLGTLHHMGAGTLALPAHGPTLPDLAAIADRYLTHRRLRLDEVEKALADLGIAAATDAETVAAVTDRVYPQIAPEVRFAAEASTVAQLAYLAG